MKHLLALAASVACFLLMVCHAQAATATVILRVAPGPTYTGLASSVLVTVYDNAHNALATASNTPDGVHSFAEEGSSGSYWALYNVDTTKLPLSYTTTITGQSLVFPPVTIGVERAIAIADGYTAVLPATITGTNTTATALSTKLGTPAGASVSADIAANLTAVNVVGAGVTGLTSSFATYASVWDAIKAKTDNLPAQPAAKSDVRVTVVGH